MFAPPIERGYLKFKAMENLIQYVQETLVKKNELPNFKSGDTVIVSYKIIEGAKERIQNFQGVVLQRRGEGLTETLTIRKFPMAWVLSVSSPLILPSSAALPS